MTNNERQMTVDSQQSRVDGPQCNNQKELSRGRRKMALVMAMMVGLWNLGYDSGRCGLLNAKIAAKANDKKMLLDLMSRSQWDFNSSYCRSNEST
jgi:hypothetical protein